ncbi:MAG: YtxH domain-containing protein [Myxococcota bacterium]
MTIQDRLAHMSDESRLRVLDSLGLEQKQDPIQLILPALGIFSAGLAVGAMLGLFFAPKSGSELRTDIRSKAHDLRERTPRYFKRSNAEVEDTANAE